MKQIIYINVVLFLAFSIITSTPLPKHWHETKGFGTTTKGGLAGEVYKVTTVNSGGKGSLRDALSKGNRLIVFEIGGVFKTGIGPKNNTTVAGQTAPYPGVTCIGGLGLRGSNVVISHVAVQYTGGGDAASVGGNNNVLDHSSVYWGKDETITFEGGTNITLYKTICAEGLQFTGHGDGEHSKGIFMKSPGKVSIIGSMVVNNALRNPRVDRGTCFLGNHLVYNHGPGWDHQGPKVKDDKGLTLDKCPHCFTKVVTGYQGTVTLVGSISLAGPESSPRAKYFLDGHNTTLTGYVKDNIIKDREGNDLFQANTEGEFTGGASGKAGAVTLKDTPPIWPEGYEPLPAHEALYEVLRTVGPHPGCRNRHAKRLVEDVANGTGKIIDNPSEVGGYADYPPSQPRPLTVPDGVEARQAWLDSLEDEIAVDTELDLSRLYGMVGSRASDKLNPATPVNNKINRQVDGFGLKIIQRQSRDGQLHVSFNLITAASVSMNIYDLAGNRILQQPDKHFKAGTNKIVVNVEKLPVGLYICRFQLGDTMINKRYNCF